MGRHARTVGSDERAWRQDLELEHNDEEVASAYQRVQSVDSQAERLWTPESDSSSSSSTDGTSYLFSRLSA